MGHFDAVRARVRSHQLTLLVALAAAAQFVYLFAVHPSRPGVRTPLGWWGFIDQKFYRSMAEDFANGTLTGRHFLYGPGYPVLGAPFAWLGLSDPFVVPDILSYAFIVSGTAVVAERLTGSRIGALLAAGLLMLASPLAAVNVIHWNSSVSAAAAVAVLLLATQPSPPRRAAPMLGLLVGWTFSTRYLDAVFLALLALPALLALRPWLRSWLAAAAGCAVPVGLTLWAQYRVFGSAFTTPYSFHIGANGRTEQSLSAFRLGSVPRQVFEMFVSPQFTGPHHGGTPYLWSMLWMLAVPVGIVIAARVWRAISWAYAASAILGLIFYNAFVAGGGTALQFGNVRYVELWLPGAAALAAAAFVALGDRLQAGSARPVSG